MSYYRPSSNSNNQKRVNAAAALREQVKNGGSFSSSPLSGSISPIGTMSQRGRPSSAPNVNNTNNAGRGLQRGTLVGASNTSAVSAYNFTPSNQNRQTTRRSQNTSSGIEKETGSRARPSSQQMQRSSFLPSNSTLNRTDQNNNRTLSRHYNEKSNETNASRNPLRANESTATGRAVAAPAPRARSSGHVRQQYLAHLGIDSSSAPTQAQNTTTTTTTDPRPSTTGGLAGRNRGTKAQSSEPVQTDNTRSLPGTSALDASPPVMQSLSGGTNVWWKRAFAKGDGADGGGRTRPTEGKRGVHFHDQVEVRFVPLHSDYSQRVRQKYWNNAQELWEMAARNSIEYASEGYDFRNVVEEENFTRWGGQLIHPAHVQGNPSFGLNRTR